MSAAAEKFTQAVRRFFEPERRVRACQLVDGKRDSGSSPNSFVAIKRADLGVDAPRIFSDDHCGCYDCRLP